MDEFYLKSRKALVLRLKWLKKAIKTIFKTRQKHWIRRRSNPSRSEWQSHVAKPHPLTSKHWILRRSNPSRSDHLTPKHWIRRRSNPSRSEWQSHVAKPHPLTPKHWIRRRSNPARSEWQSHTTSLQNIGNVSFMIIVISEEKRTSTRQRGAHPENRYFSRFSTSTQPLSFLIGFRCFTL